MHAGLLIRFLEVERARLRDRAARLLPAFSRLLRDSQRDREKARADLGGLEERMRRALPARLAALSDQLQALDRTRQTLGYRETLRRGYAVVRGDGQIVTSLAKATGAAALEVEFHDGRLAMGAVPRVQSHPRKEPGPGQGSLF